MLPPRAAAQRRCSGISKGDLGQGIKNNTASVRYLSTHSMLSRSSVCARAFVRSFAAKSKSKAAPTEKKAPIPRIVPPPAQPANPPPVL
jgi:hypothetical protein